ncbi:surface lipoprotein assembly modifier, partial [Psychrobacter sp. Rd 27.2]|uniref:surface lipoprotein assembly modifier n=1 Tax=Psychrobacter sp. Rd 27.2 TaxID=1926479 RepID=UPI0009629679
YAKRDFWADNFWYGEKRKDNEYQFSTSISHKKFSWKEFMPKLNFTYQKIDSNLPLYERSNSSLFMEIDKKF